MPLARFLRTPSEAEAGPGHRFEAGGVYEMSARSFARWEARGYVEIVEPPDAEQPDPFGATASPSMQPQSLPVTGVMAVPQKREMRHAGRGMWHVFAGTEQLTERPVPRADAEAMVAADDMGA